MALLSGTERVEPQRSPLKPDLAVLMFTSGTTGSPKA